MARIMTSLLDASCGSLFVCYQHPLKPTSNLKVLCDIFEYSCVVSGTVMWCKGGHSKQDKKTLFYSVCMLHHGQLHLSCLPCLYNNSTPTTGYILKGQIQDEHDREGSHRLSFFSLSVFLKLINYRHM